MMFIKTIAAAAILVGATSGCVSAPSTQTATTPGTDSRLDSIRSEINGLVVDGTLASAAIGVIVDRKVVWAETFGDADKAGEVTATVHTPYGVASMGKALTATAIMTLVQSGKLDLDEDVVDILGPNSIRISAGTRAPTVRELLNMSSGVPHGALTYTVDPPANQAKILDDQSIVVFPAGSTFHYSNFSMAIAERIIAKISGVSYDAYMRDAVFAPLGMRDARIGANAPGAVARYRDNGAPYGPLTPYPRSSRQISASLSDLLRFAAFQLQTPFAGQRNILTPEWLAVMQNERAKIAGAHLALGIANFDLGGGRRWLISSGNDMGVQSSMTLLPEEGVGVVFLTNSSGYQADEIGLKAADAIIPGFIRQATDVIGEFEGRTTAFHPDAGWRGGWRGVVKSASGDIAITLQVDDAGGVMIGYDGAPTVGATEISIRDGMLSGVFEGVLPLEETPDGPHRIEFSLIRQDGRLIGFALANFGSKRGKFEIPTPLQLHRLD
ncbi:MAG: serine hydrolase domain-containing protein [Parvularculaceae bacterium]